MLLARPLALAGLGAVAGVLLAAAPPALLAGVPVTLFLLRRRPAAMLVLAAALAAGYASGCRVEARTASNLRGIPAWPRAPPRSGTCTLEVSACGEQPWSGRAWLEGSRADGTGVSCSWPGSLPADVDVGARVRVSGRFARPRSATNPGERDPRVGLARRGIAWRAYARTADNVEVLRPAPDGITRRLAQVRRRAARTIHRDWPADISPLAAALLLGLRDGLSPSDRLCFERTGTLHVLAISGMHLVLLAGFVHALLRALGTGPRLAAAVTLGLAWAYVPVAGGAPPIRRALAVMVCYGCALVRGRPADAATALGGAALWLAWRDPADLFRPGFRLSFAAAGGIAWLAPHWYRAWSGRYALLARFPAVQQDQRARLLVWRYLLRAFPVSLAAWCATQPLVAHEFGVVTPLAPIVNVMLGPILAVCLPLAAVALCGLAPPALAATALRGMRTALATAAEWPGTCVFVEAPPLWTLLAFALGILLLRRRVGPGLLAIAVALAGAAAAHTPPTPLVALFDVGHGQALLLRGPRGCVLVDAGSRGRTTLARRTLLPGLRALGVTRLDAVVCTHADADHWNALPVLLAIVPVRRLVVGPDPPRAVVAIAHRYSVPVVSVRRGDSIAGLTVWADGHAISGSKNDRSLVLVWEAAGMRLLLPADREERGLAALLKRGVRPCDVMVAPHHGARCRVAPRLGAAASPRLLLVSTRRGFADAATVSAYGGRALFTAGEGCILLRPAGEKVAGGAWIVATFRQSLRARIRGP